MKKYAGILNLENVDRRGATYGVLEHENITDDQKRPWPSMITVPIHLYEQEGKQDKISVAFAFGEHTNILDGHEFPVGMQDVILEATE